MKSLHFMRTVSRRSTALQHSIKSSVYIHRYSFSADAETASYTLEQLKELRSISGAPLKECKKALSNTEISDNRINDALDWLRIRGQSVAQQKSGDVAKYGFIALFKQNTKASLIEVNCVTDFVENNPIFQEAVANIGNTIAENDTDIAPNQILDVEQLSRIPVIQFPTNQRTQQTITEALTDIVSSIRENLVFRRAYKIQCTSSGTIGGYLHGRKTDKLGMKGSIVSLETDLPELNETVKNELDELAHSIATHIVANYPQPKYIRKEDLTEQEIEKEKELILKQIMDKEGDSGKNLEIVQKQIDGRMRKFFMENVLMEQPFCLEDDNKLTIAKLIQNKETKLKCSINVGNMAVYNLGES